MRSLWTGSISFGLVTIPVTMYSAAKSRAIEFDMLRESDHCPISYKRVCSADGQEVPYEQIVKGYEVSKDTYVALTEEDFKRAAADESDLIDILQFVSASEIESKYFEKPYYLEPGKGADKAYALLREVLEQEQKVGVAKMVFRAREDLVAIVPDGELLMVVQLRYPEEIRPATEVRKPKTAELSASELKMAADLVKKMKGKFKPDEHHDEYFQKLEKVIKAKAKGRKFKPLKKVSRPTAPVDLVAQLRASLTA